MAVKAGRVSSVRPCLCENTGVPVSRRRPSVTARPPPTVDTVQPHTSPVSHLSIPTHIGSESLTTVLCGMDNFEKIWDLRPPVATVTSSSVTTPPSSPAQGSTPAICTTPATVTTSSTVTKTNETNPVQPTTSTGPRKQREPAAAVAGHSGGK